LDEATAACGLSAGRFREFGAEGVGVGIHSALCLGLSLTEHEPTLGLWGRPGNCPQLRFAAWRRAAGGE
jgi:hypothetical protein